MERVGFHLGLSVHLVYSAALSSCAVESFGWRLEFEDIFYFQIVWHTAHER